MLSFYICDLLNSRFFCCDDLIRVEVKACDYAQVFVCVSFEAVSSVEALVAV